MPESRAFCRFFAHLFRTDCRITRVQYFVLLSLFGIRAALALYAGIHENAGPC
jgi:hypothetical protein